MRWFFPLAILMSGCLTNTSSSLTTEAMSENNINNLNRIEVGMSESQVLEIMRKPYSQKTFEHDGDTYDIWFYVTRMTGMDQSRMTPQNLTPLTFKNGILIGWGFNHYNYLMKQEELKTRADQEPLKPRPQPKPQPQSKPMKEEDTGLEKALQTAPGDQSKPGQKGAQPQQKTQPAQPGQKGAQPQQKTQPAQPGQKSAQPGQPQPKSQPQPQPKSQPALQPQQQPAAQPQKPKPQQPVDDSAIPLPQPPPPPEQPMPVQPPEPVQPNPGKIVPMSAGERGGELFLAMSSKPKNDDEQKESGEKTQDSKSKKKGKPYLDDEDDREMIEQENEQNFDFW